MEYVLPVGFSILVFCIVQSIIEIRRKEKYGASLYVVFGVLDILLCAGILFSLRLFENAFAGSSNSHASNTVVTVYDIGGDVVRQYEGASGIETDKQSYILFEDEQGKRHVIYYTTGTVTVDEK